MWAILWAGAVLFMLPMYLMVVMSLKSEQELLTSTPWDLPRHWAWENYLEVLTHPMVNFGRLFLNTVLLSLVVTLGVTISSSLVAYPFARLNFHGRDKLFGLLLATMMLPGAVTMIPSYQLSAILGWIDTWHPFWVPSLLGAPFFVFLIRQFLLGIPRDMDEAAIIDGANDLTIFARILAPNMKPVLATVAVFTFIGTWRDFMGPLLYLNSVEKQTLEIGLRTFQSFAQTKWHLIMAGSVVATLPLVVIFIFCQRFFIQGITLTGGK
jgi:ABC-type glycerol-3-phosphate transport system permease component